MFKRIILTIMFTFLLPPINGKKETGICDYCEKVIFRKYLLVGNKSYHKKCYEDSVRIKCEHCNDKIIKEYIRYENKHYHSNCYELYIQLKCDFCLKKISNRYSYEDSYKYHTACFVNNILEKCDVCLKPLEGEFIIDYWGNRYHKDHQKSLPICESCNRLVSKELTEGGYLVNENRNICSLCFNQVINKKSQIVSLEKEIRILLAEVGIKKIPLNIPITLLNSRLELEKVSKINSKDVKGYTHYNKTTLGGVKIKEDFHIYLLSNLHPTAFKSVLAHEFLHVYLFLNNYDLKSEIIEGFCNLGSKLVLETSNTDLSNYYLKSMYENNHPDYGKGFIKMDLILKKNGWEKLLSTLKNIK